MKWDNKGNRIFDITEIDSRIKADEDFDIGV